MGLLYGRAGRLTALFGGFRPGQVVEGSFMSAVRVLGGFWPAGIKPGAPPVVSDWVVLPGLARQPVLITNVTLLHHRNESFFQLRGFWTVIAANVIFSRNTILGGFGYAIDLDSSSSANLVVNNFMKGCLWEGIFTEYSAVGNTIVGNTVIANVTYDQGIHINGELNVVVDNTVLMLDGVTPGGIACTSQLKMYNSYALSNRILGNTCGRLALGGDGGNDNYAAENSVNISVAGAASPSVRDWFKGVNASSRIAGVDTAEAAVVSDVGYSRAQSKACATGAPNNCAPNANDCGPVPSNCGPTNRGLTRTIEIVGNRVQSGGQSVATVTQLQALLDAHPNTVFKVSKSRWEIDARDPKSIWLRSNRSLLMDGETVITSAVLMPSTENKTFPSNGKPMTGYVRLATVAAESMTHSRMLSLCYRCRDRYSTGCHNSYRARC
jgi:parallel beta-helix repeat protein